MGEVEYINLLKNVLANGEERGDRTGVGTTSIFGPQIEFDLTESFPLLTTKKLNLRMIFEELMWFLKGQTNNKILNDKKVHIWDANSSNEYMKKIGLDHYPEGELGPIYGAQWRNFGGVHNVETKNHIEEGGGFDQIKDILNLLKKEPESRRIIVSAWNPKALHEMALPPCHLMFQFYVRRKTFLDCKLIIRSNDLFLGAPFNIASYAMLTYIVAAMNKFTPGKLIYSIGDAHIYSNHIDQVKEQITRDIRPFPKLKILNVKENIEDFEFTDFELVDYNPHSFIYGKMAV
jgi:thymidylate synthase